MTRKITSLVLIICLALSSPAFADSKYERVRGWIAESMEWRLSYLPTTYQEADVVSLPGFAFEGAATMKRTRNGFSGRIMTNVATAGDAYTLWLVVINNPGACSSTPCAEADLFNPDTESSAYNGSGAISASNGKGGGVINFDFRATAGPLPDGVFALFGDNPGLQRGNGFGAEVWLVIDLHPPLPAGVSWVDDLTKTNFPGGPASNHRIAIFTAVE